MRKGFIHKTFVHFLCVSLFLLMSGFHQWVAEAKETDLFIGGMVSRGEVKFEERENVWQNVEPSYFPILKGTKIRTEKGVALITLTNKVKMQMDQNGLLSLSQNDRLVLTKGHISFWIPSSAGIDLKVGNLSVIPSRTHHAANAVASAPSQAGETIGSISIHANGQVSVKSIQGNLTILNQNQLVLAAISSKESVTIPSIHSDTIQVAQVDEEATQEKAPQKGLGGLSTWTWVGIGAGVVAVVVIALAAGGGGGGGGGDHETPVCP
jgi:hypothetical protein